MLAEDPDLAVIGNAVRAENPEARAILDEGIPYRSFPDALYELAIAGRHSVVVSGTHGKTTTTALVGSLLLRTGRDPSLLVGGHALDFDGSFREGPGEHFVVEGDEYDTAFFDKTPKFLHYHPRTLAITSVEFDHADIYRDLDHVKQAFRTLVRGLPRDGCLVAALGHEGVRDVAAEAPCRVVGYGVGAAAGELRLARRATSRRRPRARASRCGAAGGRWRRPGCRSSARTTSRTRSARWRSSTRWASRSRRRSRRSSRSAACGVGWRCAATAGGVSVLDDFAHHPTAVEATLEAVRARYPGRRVVAIFEPRTNTSRRKVFQASYAAAFDRADDVVVRIVPDTPIYSATGEVTERFSAEELVRDLGARGVSAVALPDVESIVAHVAQHARPGDVAVVMSNGDFGGVWEKLLDALARKQP